MSHWFRSGLILIAGVALLFAALVLYAILLETVVLTMVLAGAGAVLSVWGAVLLRAELGTMLKRRRAEIALYTFGVIGVLVALAYLSARFPLRYDMTEAGLYSLSDQTVTMLERLDKPVDIVFFHDALMDEAVDLFKLVASKTDKVSVEFYDPTLNPAQARMLGVQFAGTSVMRSGEQVLKVNGGTEADIANGILRVSQGAKQRVCFLDGHGEADPFSMEAHDHQEGGAGHSHGLGAQYVLHARHGLAKARHALETTNYEVAKVSLVRGGDALAGCALLVVAGPKVELLAAEVTVIRDYLANGGNGLFMLDPFLDTGLEPVILEYGVTLDDTIVIDEASHFWTDVSSPAVTAYNPHQVTRDLPLTFYPGARSLSPTAEPVPGTNVLPVVNSSRTSYAETDSARAEFDRDRDRPGPATVMVVAIRRPLSPGALTIAQLGPQDENSAAEQAAQMAATEHVAAPSRIAVIGDSDFATNSFFHILGNGNLFLNTVNYLTAQENLIGIEPPTRDLPRLNVTNRQMKGTFVAAVMLVPALLAMVGVAVWWRQR